MCYFIPYFMQYFSYCKIKNLSTFVTEICLCFLVLLLGFHLLITFLPFHCLFFKRLFYYSFFVILNDTIKVTAYLKHNMVILQSRCPTFNLNYMLCEYLRMCSDKINKCESRIFTNVRYCCSRNFLLSTLFL